MIGDSVTPRDRLRCMSPECWSWKLALVFIAIAIVLALTLEARASDMPPFKLAHPLCQTGFWIKQRVDERDRNGIIIKSRWVFGCAKGRIVYGRKV